MGDLERVVRAGIRTDRPEPSTGHGADAHLRQRRDQAGGQRGHLALRRRQSPGRAGRRRPRLLAGHRQQHRDRPGAGMWQVPGAVDGARLGRGQHARPRPAAVRRLRGPGVHVRQGPSRVLGHVPAHPAGRGASGGPPGEEHAAVSAAQGQGLRLHRGLRLGATEVVLARRARGGPRLPSQRRVRGRGGRVPGRARAGRRPGVAWLCQVRRVRGQAPRRSWIACTPTACRAGPAASCSRTP